MRISWGNSTKEIFLSNTCIVMIIATIILSIMCAFTYGRLYQQGKDEIVINRQQCRIEMLLLRLEQKVINTYEMEARRVARRYNLDEELVLAIMWQESRFKPNCVSPVGAYGLMQLMPGTMKELGISREHSWEENIHAGVRYICWLKKRVDSLDHVLIAYNWGIGNLRKYTSGQVSNLPRETANYIVQVKKHMRNKPWRRLS